MLYGIEFNDKRFVTNDDYNIFSGLTNNTIILCNNSKIMDTLATEIINTVNGNAEYNDYWCDVEDVGQARLELCFGLQRIIDINGQKITLSIEPAIIYKANKPEDLWFFDWKESTDSEQTQYQEFIYPMTIFKGSREIWNLGKETLYKTICNGQYGCYDGNWVSFSTWAEVENGRCIVEEMPEESEEERNL